MGTFGNTNIEDSYVDDTTNKICGNKHTCPEACMADSISVYLKHWDSGEKVKCALYDASRNYIDTTEELTTGGIANWYTFNFSSPPNLLAGVDYIIVMWSDSSVQTAASWVGGTAYWLETAAYNGWPASLNAPTSAFIKSIYVNYTVGWSGKISGITDPAKVAGVDKANIAKVKGIS